MEGFAGGRPSVRIPKQKYDLSGAIQGGGPGGLYYYKDLDKQLRQAGNSANRIDDNSRHIRAMKRLASLMDDAVGTPRGKPQSKLISPYGDMVDDFPVQFRNGGKVG